MQDALVKCQEAFYGLFRNLPGRLLPRCCASSSFRGAAFSRRPTIDSDLAFAHRARRGPSRDSLARPHVHRRAGPIAVLEAALLATIEAEPLEHKLLGAGLSAAAGHGPQCRRRGCPWGGAAFLTQPEGQVVRAGADAAPQRSWSTIPERPRQDRDYQTTEPVRFTRGTTQPV